LYQSGLDRGDRILSIDGKVFKTQQELNDWLKGKKPQDRVTSKVETITGRREVEVVLGAVETFEIVPFEQAQRDLSPQQIAFRDKWLTSKAKRPSPELHRYCPQCRRAHPFEFENCPYDGKALQLVQ
jgi:predicted metalloprotease with PDZ domain